jgi:hypothetical protein
MRDFCWICNKKVNAFYWRMTNDKHWICEKHFNPSKPSIKTRMEHYATPFWKHMGKSAKPEEKLMEREMRRRGITYLDLQKERVYERKKQGLAFDATKLKQQLEKGELPVKKPAPYRKLRASGNGVAKTI